MKITFGMFLDGAEWSGQSASLGEIVCGPESFLTLLEQRTGLSGKEASLPERINEYMQKISAVNPVWCRTSFQLDAWSTAKQMLTLRDELYLNGWNGSDAPSEKLKAIAQIEASILPISPGVPDRMKKLLSELEHSTFSDTLYLHDEFKLLPYYWQKIVDQLEKCGMKVTPLPSQTAGTPQIIKVSGSNEFTLAAELARYLSAAEDDKRIAVICEGPSAVLDGVLHRLGKGMIGNEQASRWRETLQILPLWLETMWKPFNPLRFLELLTLSCSPIPKIAARNLIRALQKAPGIGGEEWQAAWQRTCDTIRENKHGFYEDVEAECKKISELQNFLENECFNSDTGVLENTLIKRCEYLEKRLTPQIKQNPSLAIAVSHVQTLKKISVGKGIISKVALARMLDSIVSTGTKPANSVSQVTSFFVFSHPGMLNGCYDAVLWWNCVDGGHAAGGNWTAEEIAVLPGFDRSVMRKLENNAWQRAKNSALKELIVFIPQNVAGQAVFQHALLDEPDISGIPELEPQSLVDDSGQWSLGSCRKQLTAEKTFSPSCVPLTDGEDIHAARNLSFTQLNTMLSCPRQWFFQDYLYLRLPPAMELPSKPGMLGTLAHKVIEVLFHGREQISEDEACRSAGEIFDRLLPEMAAELLQGRCNVEKLRFRKILIDSVGFLVKEINSRGLLVKACEKELFGTFEGVPFGGFSDLYLEDKNGNRFVIDMKWSTNSDYEINLKENKALQLAVYSWLLDPEEMDVKCAYYLFPKKQFLHNDDADWKELMRLARACWHERMQELHSGLLSKGTEDNKTLENSPLPLALKAGCKYCDFSALCNIMEGLI